MINFLKAIFIAIKAHKGQKDKGGRRYIFHPIKVSLGVKSKDAKIVAILHDVLEDSNYTIKDLNFLTYKQKKALLLLTHKKDEDYFEYIYKIKKNTIAKEVKLSDLKQNMNLKRLKNIDKKDIKRYDKYTEAIRILKY